MIKSMTGYGKGEAVCGDKKITVEIRALNSKQLDLSVKSPSIYRQCEYELRTAIAKTMQRGKVDVFVSCENSTGTNTVTINQKAFADYLKQLKTIAQNNGLSDLASGPLVGSNFMEAMALQIIMRLPEVMQNESAVTVGEEEVDAIRSATDLALSHIEEFRQQEGAILIADLLQRIDKIEELKNRVTPYEKTRTEIIKTRIRENLANLNIPVDSNRLEQEMIFYIEKLDITEEKVRLQNHCNYFREVAHGEDGVGRKLGFIAQELGREINTLGSKANEATIQKIVVEMKDELEKIKEQLLNIL